LEASIPVTAVKQADVLEVVVVPIGSVDLLEGRGSDAACRKCQDGQDGAEGHLHHDTATTGFPIDYQTVDGAADWREVRMSEDGDERCFQTPWMAECKISIYPSSMTSSRQKYVP